MVENNGDLSMAAADAWHHIVKYQAEHMTYIKIEMLLT